MIQPSHKGRLHAALGVPAGKPIPAAKIKAAKNSKNPHVRQMATFAENAKGFAHPKAKKIAAKKPRAPKTASVKAPAVETAAQEAAEVHAPSVTLPPTVHVHIHT